MSTASFLSVPAEIRVLIYRELFSPLRILLSNEDEDGQEYQWSDNINVMFANKMIYAEARPVFLSSALFRLGLWDIRSYNTQLDQLRPSELPQIKRLDIVPAFLCDFDPLRFIVSWDIAAVMRGKTEVHIRLPRLELHDESEFLTKKNAAKMVKELSREIYLEASIRSHKKYLQGQAEHSQDTIQHGEEAEEADLVDETDSDYGDVVDEDELDDRGLTTGRWLSLRQFVQQCTDVMYPGDQAGTERGDAEADNQGISPDETQKKRSNAPELYITFWEPCFNEEPDALLELYGEGDRIFKYNRQGHSLELQGPYRGTVKLPRPGMPAEEMLKS